MIRGVLHLKFNLTENTVLVGHVAYN